jgi:hypothetical protein
MKSLTSTKKKSYPCHLKFVHIAKDVQRDKLVEHNNGLGWEGCN